MRIHLGPALLQDNLLAQTYRFVVRLPLRNKLQLGFHLRPHVRLHQLGVHARVAADERDPELRRHELPAGLHRHVVALRDVVDVDRDGGVRSDPVLLHQRDELRFREVAGRRGFFLHELGVPEIKDFYGLVLRDCSL